ncbi:dipeptidase PepE [Solitalea sp. MAHUQ-68]|uniref:dipeptidase E n=1 Tax=Solitalea agri TaxID=2953739 RepID=A0A9X2F4X8_9SPHI|nr:dipeptidase PepE [Solitalea agri]MCO4291948.1 dipeptidase PepE [Solitalea agri]
MMNLLLLSNSTNAGESYLEYPKQYIADFLAKHNITEVLFIPFAAVTFSYDEYLAKVQQRFSEFDVKVNSIHTFNNPINTVNAAQAIVIGGGNTFHLLKNMQELGLIDCIRQKVLAGTPYIGWSAGTNVTCPTICTTNDMPIVQPQSFNALNLIPFQINPHYLDSHPDNHAGETREQRLLEYITANPNRYVAGLREGCMFYVENNTIRLEGRKSVRIFRTNEEIKELNTNDDFSFLLD